MTSDPIAKAIEKAGSVKALAEQLGIKPQGISQWKRVPIEHARTISALTDTPLHEIRPDVWTESESPTPADAA
jgi:DNA-binding transcriptional regulator YdaS (Cro superfamily)